MKQPGPPGLLCLIDDTPISSNELSQIPTRPDIQYFLEKNNGHTPYNLASYIMSHAILIIDDEPNLRCTLSLLLSKAGYLVYTAATPNQALDLMATRTYDLVFIDLKLPDDHKNKILDTIQKKDPKMPLLILSPQELTCEDDARLADLPWLLLVKPIDPAAILFHVGRIFGEEHQVEYLPGRHFVKKII